jgi:hypothetical protein
VVESEDVVLAGLLRQLSVRKILQEKKHWRRRHSTELDMELKLMPKLMLTLMLMLRLLQGM